MLAPALLTLAFTFHASLALAAPAGPAEANKRPHKGPHALIRGYDDATTCATSQSLKPRPILALPDLCVDLKKPVPVFQFEPHPDATHNISVVGYTVSCNEAYFTTDQYHNFSDVHPSDAFRSRSCFDANIFKDQLKDEPFAFKDPNPVFRSMCYGAGCRSEPPPSPPPPPPPSDSVKPPHSVVPHEEKRDVEGQLEHRNNEPARDRRRSPTMFRREEAQPATQPPAPIYHWGGE